MRVVVANPPGSAKLASAALDREGVRHENVDVDDSYGYAGMLALLWGEARGFVLVEHDVIPWPGAIDRLVRCQEPWCVHEYPVRAGNVTWALGLCKFSDALVRSRPDVPDAIAGTFWNRLDATLPLTLRRGAPHLHEPPVAHIWAAGDVEVFRSPA